MEIRILGIVEPEEFQRTLYTANKSLGPTDRHTTIHLDGKPVENLDNLLGNSDHIIKIIHLDENAWQLQIFILVKGECLIFDLREINTRPNNEPPFSILEGFWKAKHGVNHHINGNWTTFLQLKIFQELTWIRRYYVTPKLMHQDIVQAANYVDERKKLMLKYFGDCQRNAMEWQLELSDWKKMIFGRLLDRLGIE